MIFPPPLRTDASNEFAHHSMRVRVPAIARDVVMHNADYPPTIQRSVFDLANEIENDAPLPQPLGPGPDVAEWSAAYAPHRHERWLGTEWFYAEHAFYRELVRRCRFWETGRDPFAPVKEEELAGDRPWARVASALEAFGAHPSTANAREGRLAGLLEQCLWGNRVDLSYAIAAARTHAHDGDLLVDGRWAAVARLAQRGAHVHFAVDNTGTELALDLTLVDALLEDEDARVTLHVKMHPVFVSDATAADVLRLLARMAERSGTLAALAVRLRARFDAGRLVLAPDPFWSGPRFLRQAPSHVHDALASGTILVLKGDANYRRLVGDALWPPDAPFAAACVSLPFPVVCLRTMKSDPVLGLPVGLAGQLDAIDDRWRINGKRGIIQTHVPELARP